MFVWVAILLSVLCIGCGNIETDENKESTQTAEQTAQELLTEENTEEESETATIPPLTEYVSKEDMALADYWPSCDDRALAEVMRKAQNQEPVTIACIGGSITQGTISKGSLDSEVAKKSCYADIFFEWWTQTYPDTEFQFINAGIGATDSYLGVHRVEEDVLAYEPDLVLVEYSVNDENSAFYKKTYDNLVRKILMSDSSPAVMLLFMGQSNGQSAQTNHVLVGFQYQLPMISYVNVMKSMMEQGLYEDTALSGDVTHPSALGHAITGEILWKYLNQVYQEKDTLEEAETFDKAAVTNDMYQEAQLLTRKTLTADTLGSFEESSVMEAFPDSWTCKEGEGGITFTVKFANLGMLYLDTIDGLSGQYEVLIDGEVVAVIDADFQGGWGNYAKATELYRSERAVGHTVTIRKAEDSTGEQFTLFGLLVS